MEKINLTRSELINMRADQAGRAGAAICSKSSVPRCGRS